MCVVRGSISRRSISLLIIRELCGFVFFHRPQNSLMVRSEHERSECEPRTAHLNFRLARAAKRGYLTIMNSFARATFVILTQSCFKFLGAALLLTLLNSGRRV